MTTDPFPAFTAFLELILLYMIYSGVILSGISAVLSGILFLPVFGLSVQRTAIAVRALQFTGIGLLVILLAIPARNALIAHFPLPAGVPTVPLSTPVVPAPTPKPAG
jgi:hypothetical protein